MKKTSLKCFMIASVLCLSAVFSFQAWAEESSLTYSVSFTPQECDDILAPIALYPDPLLAQVLPASTYPAEIADAQAWLQSGGNIQDVDNQNWDESVKAVARYPDVLNMMADNMDWTANLGDAFINQPEDVTDSIQRLRRQAKDIGNLTDNDKQSVTVNEGNIVIVPTQPQYIYVPQYDPVVVYVRRPEPRMLPLMLFGPPLLLGGWLTMDFDWGNHNVIFHGWNRPGWVNHARPHVHVSNVYINRSRPAINQRWRHDNSRGDPARYLASRPSGPHANRYERTGEVRGRTTVKPKPTGRLFVPNRDAHAYSNRGKESRGIVNMQPKPPVPGIVRRPAVPVPRISGRPDIPTPRVGERRTVPAPSVGSKPQIPSPRVTERRTIPAPSVSQKPSIPATTRGDIKRPGTGRETVQPVRKPSAAFGGYRGAAETKAQSQRGQVSRKSSEIVRPSPAPAGRGNAPSGRDAPGDRQRR